MIEVPGWMVLNFFTSFLLILLLIFQSSTSRLQKGKKYSAILTCTLILLISETIGRVGEMHPDNLLFLARMGYLLIFLLDPVDILYAVSYVDCWMDSGNSKPRTIFKMAFQIFALVNIVLVSISSIFDLRWFFYFEDGLYYRGTFFLVRALFLMVFMILLLVYAVVFRKDFMSEYKNIILYLPFLALLGSLLQVFLSNIDATYGGISLACLILFFFYQSKDVNMDYLSGVLNRRGLDIKMEEKIKSSQQNGRDFTAIMMDLDNFKLINDNLGHDEGDKAIKIMADILVHIFGENAVIGRFGGDEFCVITDNVEKTEIEDMIDHVRKKLAKAIYKNNWPAVVDVSCGYEIYNHSSNVTFQKFVEQIDMSMYHEKALHHKNDKS